LVSIATRDVLLQYQNSTSYRYFVAKELNLLFECVDNLNSYNKYHFELQVGHIYGCVDWYTRFEIFAAILLTGSVLSTLSSYGPTAFFPGNMNSFPIVPKDSALVFVNSYPV
jgi:hypothetical protein